MNDPRQMTDQQLNIAIEVLLGAEEDRHRPGLVLKGGYSSYPKRYSNDPAFSLELQAAALAADASLYCTNLAKLLEWDSDSDPLDYDNDLFSYSGVAVFLQATNRQRAEAVYVTLLHLKEAEKS
ncbi:hypothetical protein [Paenibacillus massiliensis]|uniref:hypothetical protein n=1 Tax=Paenibacillus massiliensis TaxID=225917 RepID=UPI0003F74260|nr:hypothetical protein [Paenibacillus massiliensis]